MKRFTISLDDDLAVQLDRLMKERNYSNRSEVFRDILRDIIAKEDLTRGDAEALAVVSYSFNHHKRQLTERMNEIQHANIGLVVTAMHVHVSHEVCSETIILRGPVSEIQSLALSIVSAPGVHYGKINLMTIRMNMSMTTGTAMITRTNTPTRSRTHIPIRTKTERHPDPAAPRSPRAARPQSFTDLPALHHTSAVPPMQRVMFHPYNRERQPSVVSEALGSEVSF